MESTNPDNVPAFDRQSGLRTGSAARCPFTRALTSARPAAVLEEAMAIPRRGEPEGVVLVDETVAVDDDGVRVSHTLLLSVGDRDEVLSASQAADDDERTFTRTEPPPSAPMRMPPSPGGRAPSTPTPMPGSPTARHPSRSPTPPRKGPS